MDKYAIYLYGVTYHDSVNELDMLGIDNNNKLYSVEYNDLKAIVSNVLYEEFNEESFAKNVEDMNWLKENAVLHSNIVNELFNTLNGIVPVKFGSIFVTEEGLCNFLIENYQYLIKNIEISKGKEEWGIKIYSDINKFITTNMKDEKQEVSEQASEISTGAGYFLKKKLFGMIEQKAKDKIIMLSQKIFDEISVRSVESKLNKLLSKEATGVSFEMYLNSVFLINKDKVDLFKSMIEEYKHDYKNIGLYIEESGPWPTYNFMSID